MPTLQPPRWLMIGGAFLVFPGIIGLAVSRKKEVESGTAVRPGVGQNQKQARPTPRLRKPNFRHSGAVLTLTHVNRAIQLPV